MMQKEILWWNSLYWTYQSMLLDIYFKGKKLSEISESEIRLIYAATDNLYFYKGHESFLSNINCI